MGATGSECLFCQTVVSMDTFHHSFYMPESYIFASAAIETHLVVLAYAAGVALLKLVSLCV